MMLIVGLGNPGEKYKNTPHNVGFKVVEEFAKEKNLSDFRFLKKANALVSENTIGNEPTTTSSPTGEWCGGKKIIIAKPQSFMNVSGTTIVFLNNFYKTGPENNIVIHDDIDLPVGKIRVSKGQGSAGHKGVQSIIKNLGTQDFVRIRIGVAPEKGKPKEAEKFVVKNFARKEQEKIKKAIKKAVTALDLLIKEGVEKAMNEYNK